MRGSTHFRSGSDGGSYLLDGYQNAVVSLSLKRLSPSFSDEVLVVRRADDVEKSIYLNGDNLDASDLTSFLNGMGGFVKSWRDQSLLKSFTQDVKSDQPRIADDNGDLILDEYGNISIKFNESPNCLLRWGASPIEGAGQRSIFVVNQQNSTQSRPCVLYHGYSAAAGQVFSCLNEYAVRVVGGNAVFQKDQSLNKLKVGMWSLPQGDTTDEIRAFENGSEITRTGLGSTAINTSYHETVIGKYFDGGSYDGLISEVVIFSDNKVPQQAEIYNNIISKY